MEVDVIRFEDEFPQEAAILMRIYNSRPKFNSWVKKKRRFIPHYFPEIDYMNLTGIDQ